MSLGALTLRPYQREGRDFLAARRRAILADEMRVGKTPQAILAARKIGAQRLLVVCPAIAVRQWEREIKRWWGGSILPEATVVSYNMATRRLEELKKKRYDVLIVDEAHFAKNPEAQRTKVIYGKGGLGHYADRIWALSGTPAPNHAGEMWPVLRAFGIVGMTYDEFIRRYCVVSWPAGKIVGTNTDRIPELRALFKDHLLRRKRIEVAPDMPNIGFELLEVQPDLDVLKDEEADVELHAIWTALEKLPEDQRAAHLEMHSRDFIQARVISALAKASSLADHICHAFEAKLLRQTVVFGHHYAPLIQLCDELSAAGLRVGRITGSTPDRLRQSQMAAFQEGKLDVMVCNILAAGTAIDLSAADHGYFLELDWVPGNNAQAAARLVSMVKKTPVTYDIATWAGGPDETIMNTLMRKTQQLSQLY